MHRMTLVLAPESEGWTISLLQVTPITTRGGRGHPRLSLDQMLRERLNPQWLKVRARLQRLRENMGDNPVPGGF